MIARTVTFLLKSTKRLKGTITKILIALLRRLCLQARRFTGCNSIVWVLISETTIYRTFFCRTLGLKTEQCILTSFKTTISIVNWACLTLASITPCRILTLIKTCPSKCLTSLLHLTLCKSQEQYSLLTCSHDLVQLHLCNPEAFQYQMWKKNHGINKTTTRCFCNPSSQVAVGFSILFKANQGTECH